MKQKITINGQEVKIKQVGQEDYFCITDIAKSGDGKPSVIVRNYLRNRNTIAFLGFWEQLHNKKFNGVGFDTIDKKTGLNSFSISPSKWVDETDAIGMLVERGHKGGVYAHKDIVIHFTSWFSVPFYTYLIKEFQYLSEEKKRSLRWHLKKITNNIEETRNLLDTIPMQKDELNRLKRNDDTK